MDIKKLEEAKSKSGPAGGKPDNSSSGTISLQSAKAI